MASYAKDMEKPKVVPGYVEKNFSHFDSSMVRSQPIPWDGYRRAELLSDPEFTVIERYDNAKTEENRFALIKEVLLGLIFLDRQRGSLAHIGSPSKT